jgi:hypothetical protein
MAELPDEMLFDFDKTELVGWDQERIDRLLDEQPTLYCNHLRGRSSRNSQDHSKGYCKFHVPQPCVSTALSVGSIVSVSGPDSEPSAMMLAEFQRKSRFLCQ